MFGPDVVNSSSAAASPVASSSVSSAGGEFSAARSVVTTLRPAVGVNGRGQVVDLAAGTSWSRLDQPVPCMWCGTLTTDVNGECARCRSNG